MVGLSSGSLTACSNKHCNQIRKLSSLRDIQLQLIQKGEMIQADNRFRCLWGKRRFGSKVTEFAIPHPIVNRVQVDHLWIEGAEVRFRGYLL